MSHSLDIDNTWLIRQLPPVILTWGHHCPHCHILLLTGEKPGFCCGPNGSRLNDVPPLPPLPNEFNIFLNDTNISASSRILNLIFSFASLETTHAFPQNRGPLGFFSIQGKVYHRVRPTHKNSAVRWFLYDGHLNDIPHSDLAATIPKHWINAATAALLRINPFVHGLRTLSVQANLFPTAQLTLSDSGGTPEIAAIISYENTTARQIRPRQLIIKPKNRQSLHISAVSRLWEPLAYPLFFPNGSLGWGLMNNNYASLDSDHAENKPTTQMWHYRARLLREPRFRIFGRLANEYIVDMFTRDLECRLQYIRTNQLRLRRLQADVDGIYDAEGAENIYLPSSFIGSKRWSSEQIADSLAIAAALGNPTFFITMTCNPDWPEIQSQLRPGQSWADIPIIVVRVFKRKLALLEQTLNSMFPNAGEEEYCIHCIEFQKRGLPHGHIIKKFSCRCDTPSLIDQVVSAEIPFDETDAALVRRFMLHKHPTLDQPPSKYCQHEDEAGNRTCRFRYPHELSEYTTIDAEGRVYYRRRHPGDEMVVPYCLPLLRAFNCHINVEVANSSHLFQYIFKYIHKGPDHTRYHLHADKDSETIDEIEDYWNGRYLSSGEGSWRIMGFALTKKKPAVTPLPVHLKHATRHHPYHRTNQQSQSSSLLDHYFIRPIGSFTHNQQQRSFDDVTYTDYYTLFRLAKFNVKYQNNPIYFLESTDTQPMHVILRNRNNRHIARLHPVRPSAGELFYFRAILRSKPIRSYDDALHIDGQHCPSFQEAAIQLGLFADENEGEFAMSEAILMLSTPRQLRFLFIHLLINDCIQTPFALWDKFNFQLAFDFYLARDHELQIALDDCLQDLARLLEEYQMHLSDFGLPEPSLYAVEVHHELAHWNNLSPTLSQRALHSINQLNAEQRFIFDSIINAVALDQPLLAFIDGKAGRGKTFLVNAICDYLRSNNQIVIPTATSAFAAQLYPGGRTTHSALKIPVCENNEMLQCAIDPRSNRAELIRAAKVFIWDEAPAANQAAFNCANETCQKCMDNDLPFGGKVFILLGDFRQTCPVVRRGSRAQVFQASIKSSPLWPLLHIYRLTQPWRNGQDLSFANFVDAVGDGAGPDIPLQMLDIVHSDEELINFVYPDAILTQPSLCLTRSILAPTNEQIDTYNDIVLARVPGPERNYFATDTLKETDEAALPAPDSILNYVAVHTPPGFPPHCAKFKIGGVYRLLRNLSIHRGLVKNVRVVIVGMANHLITVRILRNSPSPDDEDILIPRITFTTILPTGYTLCRKQFPLAPSYATTFNSCQGMTLDVLGIDLTRPVFAHGQLYTALSRVRNRKHARVRLPVGCSSTINVTYHELLV